MRLTCVRMLSVCLLALLCGLLLAGALAPAEEPSRVTTYELGGQIVARTHPDGQIEFCFRPTGQDVVCPELRVVRPERVTSNRWLVSSPIDWSVAVDPNRLPSPFVDGLQPGGDPECAPDLAGMLSMVWSVVAKGYGTNAYYIGDARFLVWGSSWLSEVAPIVTLVRGSQNVAGAIVAVDGSRNVALIEAHDASLFADEPAPRFRTPNEADLGTPVFTVRRDSYYSPAATFGHFIAAVHADQLRTGGGDWQTTRRGPLFDICGNLLAIRWDTWPEFAEPSLEDWLSSVDAEWPELPDDGASAANGDGRLAWFSGADPPSGSECASADGDWWVGLAGLDSHFLGSSALEDLGWQVTDTCYWGSQVVLALDGPPPPTKSVLPICTEDRRAEPEGRFVELIHRSSEPFGETRIVRLPKTSRCPWDFSHSLRVKLAEPKLNTSYIAHLIGVDGRAVLGTSPGRAYRGISDEVSSPTATFWQRWDIPDDFVPAAVQMYVGRQGWRAAIQDPYAPRFSIEQSAQVVVRRESGDDLLVCLRREGWLDACSVLSAFTVSGDGDGGWRQSPIVRWRAVVPGPVIASLLSDPLGADRRCPIGEDVAESAWRYAQGTFGRTALYVGAGQFLISADAIDGSTVSGIITRGGVAFAARHVATDTRNGLALLSAPDDWPLETLGTPARFGRIDDRWEGQTAWLVAYDEFDSERFSVTPARVGAVGERLIEVNALHSGRRGAPLIHPCTGEVIGVHSRGGTALRAETVEESLERLRS